MLPGALLEDLPDARVGCRGAAVWLYAMPTGSAIGLTNFLRVLSAAVARVPGMGYRFQP